MPKLKIPIRAAPSASNAPMGQRTRLATLQRLVTDEAIPLRSRVAGSIVLLYAQPISRIVRLTTDDVCWHDRGVTLMLGDPPTPVPDPLAGLLHAYIQHRPNMTTVMAPAAVHSDSPARADSSGACQPKSAPDTGSPALHRLLRHDPVADPLAAELDRTLRVASLACGHQHVVTARAIRRRALVSHCKWRA
jgi:hypothetical protein